MIAEIESILKADNAAGEELEAAAAEAERLHGLARRQAEETVSEKKRELATSIEAEEESILEEAHYKSETILNEAAQYMQALQVRKNAVLSDLIENLFGKMTRT